MTAPVRGDEVRLDTHTMTVTEMDGRRVARVRLHRIKPEAEQPEAEQPEAEQPEAEPAVRLLLGTDVQDEEVGKKIGQRDRVDIGSPGQLVSDALGSPVLHEPTQGLGGRVAGQDIVRLLFQLSLPISES